MNPPPWRRVAELLRHEECQGTGPVQLVAATEFYDEDELPFEFALSGVVCHVIPDAGFRKEGLAATEDERLLIVDCPDDEGWLCPEDIVANWLARNVTCAALEDILLAHPLYEYLTQLDERGHSRGGQRGELVQWMPGAPNIASIYAPEFLPNDPDAPAINRERGAYADAVVDLLEQLEEAFELIEVELALRFGDEPPAPDDEDEDLRTGSYAA